ncbi:MAG: mechanosensitive ion channel [Campylobacteraceae bacterium]|nr:mechanosensitive ion channel [Campylobacteraceae bacterium]
MEDITTADQRILKNPPPLVAVLELGSSSVNFAVRAWVKNDDYWNIYFYLNETVKLRFDEEGITIPYPQVEVSQKKPL